MSVSSPQIEQALWFLSLLLSVFLIFRIVSQGLVRAYAWFFVYLCVGVTQFLIAFPLNPGTNAYAWTYLISQPVIWFLYILIVLELYSLVLRNHKGIATLGSWTLSAALGISILISLLTLLPDLGRAAGPYPVLGYYTVIERGVISSLVVFLLLITVFMLWYPVSLNRNIVLHVIVYFVYFLSSTVAFFVRNVSGYEFTGTVSAILIAIADVCLLAWIVFFNRRGEASTLVLRRQFHPQDEERLVKQLDAINAALLKAAKR